MQKCATSMPCNRSCAQDKPPVSSRLALTSASPPNTQMVYDPTSLTIVSLALVPDVEALPHIVEAVNDLLRPATIDSAVYNDLQRVVKVHGDSRAWTVKAMDGAAANGRLDIMQWLHDTRTEGCSAQACIQASKHGYLDVVKWLHEFYPTVIEPVEAMTVAAKSGHAEIVRFLRSNVAMDDAVPALQDAAVNGHVEVVDALLPYYSGLAQGAFIVASGNGQTEVVRLLLDLGFTSVMYANPSLREAAAGGHIELIDLLLPFCGDEALGDALYAAVAVNRLDILQLIVEKRHPKDIGTALEQAAVNNRRDMIQFLLDNCPEEDESYLSRSSDTDRSTRWHTQRSINTATVTAATRGYVATAKALSKKSSEPAAGMALRIAVQTNNLELAKIFVMKSNPVGRVDALVAAVAVENTDMVRTLIEHGDLRMIEQALIKISLAGNHEMAATLLQRCDPASCQRVFENAATNGVVELVQQMLDQVSERTAGDALRLAAMNGHTGVVKVLLGKSDANGVVAAFNVAAMQGRLAIVELLSERD